MYRKQPYTGSDLPLNSLCLTYDDGPGKDTLEIARFLSDENIRATFFMLGKYAFHHQDILARVAELGHLIGNHTYEHPDMPYYLSKNGDIHNQVLRTDAIIKNYINEGTIYFRSPYGKWSPEVADELNRNMLATMNHIGPINWDIGGVDCLYWQKGYTVEDAVSKYLNDINEKGRGIVVMHDEIGDMEYLRERNNTLELTKQLVPLLKLKGYKFVRLDEIQSIRKDASELLHFTLRTARRKYVCTSENENIVRTRGNKDNVLNQLSMKDLGDGKIALRAANGLFFSLQGNEAKGWVIEACSKEVNRYEAFDLIPVSSNRVILRAYNGNYLVSENSDDSRLLAAASYMRGAGIFSFSPFNNQRVETISLGKRFQSLKRQFLYVKSKLRERAMGQ